MALTAEEQKLLEFALGSLPSWFRRSDEFMYGAAKMFGSVRALVEYLYGQALITNASGAGVGTPDWLDQHARDRGTGRQPGESDATLRERLRQAPDALTRGAILAAIVNVTGFSAGLLELPRDAAYFGNYTAMTGTGGAFLQSGGSTQFTPAVLPWPTPPGRFSVDPQISFELVIAGAANAGNNGTRAIVGIVGNAAVVVNGAGVTNAADAGVTWTARRLDQTGNLTDGFKRAYMGRGYRMTSARPATLIVILPFAATAGMEASIREMMRTKKAAGIRVIVERRLIP